MLFACRHLHPSSRPWIALAASLLPLRRACSQVRRWPRSHLEASSSLLIDNDFLEPVALPGEFYTAMCGWSWIRPMVAVTGRWMRDGLDQTTASSGAIAF